MARQEMRVKTNLLPPLISAQLPSQRSISAEYSGVNLQTCGRIACRNRQRLWQPGDTWMWVCSYKKPHATYSSAVQDTNRNTKVGADPVPIRIVNRSGNNHTRKRYSKGGFTHSMTCPCRALIHTRHAAPLPCSESAVSFVKVCVVAKNIQTAGPTV
jgi:hypothetical protein